MHPGVLISSALAAIIGLAIVAVIVSKNAQTGTVLQGAGTALSSVIQAAVSPVTGTTNSTGNFLGSSTGNSLSIPQLAGFSS